MGEVYKGKFGPPKEEPKNKESLPELTPEEDELADEAVRAMEAMQRALAAEKQGDPRALGAQLLFEAEPASRKILDFVESLKVSSSTEVLATAEQLWKGFSIQDLISAITDSSEADWKKAPGRYWALVKEYHRRFDQILDAFRE